MDAIQSKFFFDKFRPLLHPDFDGVEIGAHQSVILSQIPTRINPNSEHITIQSSHSLPTRERIFIEYFKPYLEINQHLSNEYANLIYYQHNDSTYTRKFNLIIDQSIEIEPSNGSYGLTNINWTFSLARMLQEMF